MFRNILTEVVVIALAAGTGADAQQKGSNAS